LAANVTDAETPTNNLTYEWTIAFAHNGHEHKNPPLLGNNISTVLPATTCEIGDATYWYKIYLTITDPQGFAKTIIKNIELNCSGSSQTLMFNAITNQEITLNTTNNTVTASATSSVGATPLYYFNIAGPAYIIDNQIKLSGKPGKITVRATQHGNGTYRPALPVEQTFDVDRTTTHYTMNFFYAHIRSCYTVG
ncbi:MAG: hypothetical protein MUF58_20810, partial [Arcicella sp.]|nr:hypothetical protein [Arcicella sp.]